MGSSPPLSPCLVTLAALQLALVASASFDDLFQPYWAPDHILISGGDQPLKLSLDNSSGCGFGSRKKYMFGQASMQIKLVGGDSAGTVIAFYMSSSEGPRHNELDFEFLGNVSGEPYLVQTNIYINGTGNREQRHTLWFDPTVDFHNYSIFWNRNHTRFMVDGVPLRVFANSERGVGAGAGGGGPYPGDQAMGVYASIWNADDWATQGGRVKTNWTHAPFVSEFRALEIDACATGPGGAAECLQAAEGKPKFWWDAPSAGGLSPHQRRQLKWARAKHLVYDYCLDTARFGAAVPGECLGSEMR